MSATISKVERKRAQSRVAQQHAREKQLARIRELESFVDHIKSTVGEEATSSDEASLIAQNARLTKAFVEVLDENAKLKQGLLRLRRTMMSLSTQAAEDAGEFNVRSAKGCAGTEYSVLSHLRRRNR
jgi:hypothetical protein